MGRWSWRESHGEFRGKATSYLNELTVRPPLLKEMTNFVYNVHEGINKTFGPLALVADPGNVPITYCSRYESSAGVERILLAGGTELYSTDGTVLGAAIKTGLASSYLNKFKDTQMLFVRYLTNEVDRVLEWNGTACYEVGNPAPTTQCAGVATGVPGAVPIGTYYYTFTNVNDTDVNNESNAAPVSAAVVVGGIAQDVNITSVDAGSVLYKCTSRRIYRGTAAAGPFYYIGTIPDRTTTTFTDNVAAPTLTSSPPTDNGNAPATAADIQIYYNTMFYIGTGADRNKVYWSKLAYPDIVPALNVKPFDNPCYALQVIGEYLYIFQDNRITAVRYTGIYSGITDDYRDANGAYAFGFETVLEGTGIYPYGKPIACVPGGAVFVEYSGDLYFFDGATARAIHPERFSWPMWDRVTGTNTDIMARYFQRENEVIFVNSWSTGAGDYAGDIWVYHMDQDSFGKLDFDWAADTVPLVLGEDMNVSSYCNWRREGILFGMSDGDVLSYNNILVAPGVPATFETGWIDFGFPEKSKEITGGDIILLLSTGNTVNNTATNIAVVTVYFSPDDTQDDYTLDKYVTANATFDNIAADIACLVFPIPNTNSVKFKAMKIKITHAASVYGFAIHDIIIPNLEDKGEF